MKRSIVLSLILAICCLLPFTASAEEWSDFFALNEETAIGYDEALASYQDTPNAPAGTRIELLPSAAILSGDAVLAPGGHHHRRRRKHGGLDGGCARDWTVRIGNHLLRAGRATRRKCSAA